MTTNVAVDHPDVIWLAKAFTRPAMAHTLAQVGFQQSYTYYAWRHGRAEPEEYCRELARPAAAYMNPSCWPTTHGILTPFVQHGGPTAWRMRAALAATLVSAHGTYAGYKLVEHLPRLGVEEQIDDEKYQYKDRGWQAHEPGAPEGAVPRASPDQAQ